MQKTIFKSLTPMEKGISEGTKVKIEIKDLLKERLRKYKGILKAKLC